jgi:FMN phosphatase YigB (HAD superfamily)
MRNSLQTPCSSTAILVDLDDTVFDTSKHIISKWDDTWATNASAFLAQECISDFREHIRWLRSVAPRTVDSWVVEAFPSIAGDLIQERDTIDKFSFLQGIRLTASDARALQALKAIAPVIIVTQGDVDFQTAKIEQLKLRSIVDDCRICDTQNGERKETTFRAIADENYDHLIVVGNRLDNEIQAGNQMGATTIWVRRGEGENTEPSLPDERPNFQVRKFEDVVPIAQNIVSANS